MPSLHWTEVDGVPTVWVDTRGPLFALLQFRTGRADETFTTVGRTHLLEHLAMSAVEDPSLQQNGFVSAVATGFHATGRPEAVVAFLAGICRAIREPPLGRLDLEKRVLGAEAQTRRWGVAERLLIFRFGAGGFGLAGMKEEGIPEATAEDLRRLAAQRFTRGNAVLCLSGPPPAGLSLDLLPGPRTELPAPVTVLPALPAWASGEWDRCAATSAILPRVPACTVFTALAGDRLRSRLRTDLGVTYSPTVHYDPLAPREAHLVLAAESEREHEEEMSRAFVDVVEGLGDASDAELEPIRDRLTAWIGEEAMRPDELALSEAQRASLEHLLGMPWEPIEAIMAGAAQVRPADIASLGCHLRETGLHFLPAGVPAREWMGGHVLVSTTGPVRGQEVAHRDSPLSDQILVHGRDGVSIRSSRSVSTVRFDGICGALAYADGGLVLVARDASVVRIEPALWRDGEDVCRDIVDRIPPEMLLRRPARDPGDVPRPATTPWKRMRARISGALELLFGPRLFLLKALGLMIIVLAVPGVAILFLTLDAGGQRPHGELPAWLHPGARWVIMAAVLTFLWHKSRRQPP